MDIKDLNKPQLLLLAVLLSFVTSIATGITTVTLMQQAPASFTAPINRVVQQTIEKIQQVEGKTVTQTVVVKEEDLVVDAIAKNKASVFAVSRDSVDGNGNPVEVGAGRGFAISKDGVVAADASFVWGGSDHVDYINARRIINGTDKAIFTVPSLGDLDKMKVGQKVLVFGNTITSSIFEGNKNVDISVTKSNAGGLVLNLDGEALGIALSGEGSSFASLKVINSALNASLGLAPDSRDTLPASPVLAPTSAQ